MFIKLKNHHGEMVLLNIDTISAVFKTKTMGTAVRIHQEPENTQFVQESVEEIAIMLTAAGETV